MTAMRHDIVLARFFLVGVRQKDCLFAIHILLMIINLVPFSLFIFLFPFAYSFLLFSLYITIFLISCSYFLILLFSFLVRAINMSPDIDLDFIQLHFAPIGPGGYLHNKAKPYMKFQYYSFK